MIEPCIHGVRGRLCADCEVDELQTEVERLSVENRVLRMVAEAADIALHSDVIGSNSFNIETLAGAVHDWKSAAPTQQSGRPVDADCVTLPNGDCVAVGACMHSRRGES